MNQFKTDVITGLQYELQGDYYVIAGEGDERPTVGIWGQRHLRWLRENRRVTYTSLLTTGRLYDICVITQQFIDFLPRVVYNSSR